MRRWMKDLGSSAATSVNHVRLNSALQENGRWKARMGDMIQLSVDRVRLFSVHWAVCMCVELHDAVQSGEMQSLHVLHG